MRSSGTIVLFAAALFACGSSSSNPDAGGPDAGDAGNGGDAGTDGGSDAGLELDGGAGIGCSGKWYAVFGPGTGANWSYTDVQLDDGGTAAGILLDANTVSTSSATLYLGQHGVLSGDFTVSFQYDQFASDFNDSFISMSLTPVTPAGNNFATGGGYAVQTSSSEPLQYQLSYQVGSQGVGFSAPGDGGVSGVVMFQRVGDQLSYPSTNPSSSTMGMTLPDGGLAIGDPALFTTGPLEVTIGLGGTSSESIGPGHSISAIISNFVVTGGDGGVVSDSFYCP